jgi:hypothetical protein
MHHQPLYRIFLIYNTLCLWGYIVDWNQILGVLAEPTHLDAEASNKTFCFLIRCSIAMRVNAIGVKHFRDSMADAWMGDEDVFNR